MWLARMTPPPKPCTASVSSRLSSVLCWIKTSGDEVRMQYGDEQCRNVESTTATAVAVAAKSIATPGPPAPPSTCSERNETALEEATLTNARAPDGTTARLLTTMRCDRVTVMPEMLAPASPASVRSADGPPRPVIATEP